MFKKYIASIKLSLNLVFLAAIISITAMEGWLSSIPEIVPWGSEFGTVFYSICLSIISSYVFYFIVVHIKSVDDKENIDVFVSKKVRNIIGDYKSQISAFEKATNSTYNVEFLNKEDVEALFLLINPHGNAPLLLGGLGNYANWLQFLNYHKSRSQNCIEKIFKKMPFLETRLVVLLAKIDDCSHFSSISFAVNTTVSNTNLKPWANCFYEYGLLCKELSEYDKRHFS